MDQISPLYDGAQYSAHGTQHNGTTHIHNQSHSWSQSRSESQAEPARLPKRRKRIAHACEACRQRKSRCDGSRPRCDFCAEQDMPCFYRDAAHHYSSAHSDTQQQQQQQHPHPSGTASSSEVASLTQMEGRLQEMESLLRSLIPSRQTVVTPASSGGDGTTSTNMNAIATVNANTKDAHESPPARVSRDRVDGMCSITFADDTSSGVFGPTSNSAFLQTIIGVQGLDVGHDEGHLSRLTQLNAAASQPASPPPRLGNDRERSISAATPPVVNPYVLPPPPRILRLIDVFFENTGRLWPFLYKPRVLENLAKMQRTACQNMEASHLCLLNLLMAFATTHCPSQTPVMVKIEQGDVFLQRALALIPNIKPAADNIESVQALLLATQYVQGTQRSSQTWEMLGNLIHACFHVGLYQQSTTYKSYSPLEAELRKRTWWMCLVMDRLCSMTYGRPLLLPNIYMIDDPPIDSDLAELDRESSREAGGSRIPVPSLFVYTSKLYIVLGSVIEKVYEHNISRSTNIVPLHSLLTRVIESEHDLSIWKQEVPAALAPTTISDLEDLSSVRDPQAYRSRVILTLRFFHVRLLLHRSILSRLLEARKSRLRVAEQTFVVAMGACSVDVCVEAAVELLTLISRHSQRQDLLPIWWYSSYFSFSSALVIYGTIFAIQKCEVPSKRYSAIQLVQFLQVALDLLGKVGSETWQVARCRKIVGRLLQAAWVLCPQPQQPDTPQVGKGTVQDGMRQEYGQAALHSTEKYPEFDFPSGIAHGFQFDLSSFNEVDFTSFYPDGF